MAQTPTVFISYRRDDSQDVSGRIYDHLEARFGARQVFKDVDSFLPGADFRHEIDRLIASCDVLLAVIGPSWMGETGIPGQRRIDRAEDFVRNELELALRREIPIIPLLVSGATMPSAATLPASLAPLAYRNALRVRADPDFRRDMDRVIEGIEVNAREAREARQRERQRSAEPAPTLSGPRTVAPPASVEPPPLAETPPREDAASALPRKPILAMRAAGFPVRRNSRGILAVAAAILVIAFSALGLQTFLSGQSAATQTRHSQETNTAQARAGTQTATAHTAATAAMATATAFLQRGYSTKTPGACDKGGGRWTQSPATFGGYETKVTCNESSSALIGSVNISGDHGSSSTAASVFYGVGSGTTTFPQNYEVSVHVSGLPAVACATLYTRAITQVYGTVGPQGYGFDVCHASAAIYGGGGTDVRDFLKPGNWGIAFTLAARCVGNHLTLLVDDVAVVDLYDPSSTYMSTNFLEIRIDSYDPNSSGTAASATLSDFQFTPLH